MAKLINVEKMSGRAGRVAKSFTAAIIVLAASAARGEIVDFVGNTEPGELSNTANWSASTWSATATQRVNGASVAVPADTVNELL